MNILTSIRSFLEKDFGSFFCDFEAFYLKDLLGLVKGCHLHQKYVGSFTQQTP